MLLLTATTHAQGKTPSHEKMERAVAQLGSRKATQASEQAVLAFGFDIEELVLRAARRPRFRGRERAQRVLDQLDIAHRLCAFKPDTFEYWIAVRRAYYFDPEVRALIWTIAGAADQAEAVTRRMKTAWSDVENRCADVMQEKIGIEPGTVAAAPCLLQFLELESMPDAIRVRAMRAAKTIGLDIVSQCSVLTLQPGVAATEARRVLGLGADELAPPVRFRSASRAHFARTLARRLDGSGASRPGNWAAWRLITGDELEPERDSDGSEARLLARRWLAENIDELDAGRVLRTDGNYVRRAMEYREPRWQLLHFRTDGTVVSSVVGALKFTVEASLPEGGMVGRVERSHNRIEFKPSTKDPELVPWEHLRGRVEVRRLWLDHQWSPKSDVRRHEVFHFVPFADAK
jgi:hypothetical protein